MRVRISSFRQRPHFAAGHNLAVRIGLVVGIDIAQLVAVVHHHGVGLLEAVGAGIGQPVEALDDGAVAEMEMRHAVERSALDVGGREEMRRQPRQDGPQRLVDRGHLPPGRLVEQFAHRRRAARLADHRQQGCDLALGQRVVALALEAAVDVLAQARDGRQGGELLHLRQFLGEPIGHALDQEVAEADAGQALLAVGDGIEDGGVGVARIARLGAGVEQALHVAGETRDQRDLDEDQRLVRHARMEEGKAAPVGIEPVLQVSP